MNPETIIRSAIFRLDSRPSRSKSSLQVSIPLVLSEFQWNDRNFESLIEKFLEHVLEISIPAGVVRVAVHEMKRKTDLEEFTSVHPEYWLHLSVESQAETGYEGGAKQILQDLGYQCAEWIGLEESESKLGVFRFGTQDMPALILFIQNRRALRNCDFLIPVVDLLPSSAQADISRN
jgi:hypothetical protein